MAQIILIDKEQDRKEYLELTLSQEKLLYFLHKNSWLNSSVDYEYFHFKEIE